MRHNGTQKATKAVQTLKNSPFTPETAPGVPSNAGISTGTPFGEAATVRRQKLTANNTNNERKEICK